MAEFVLLRQALHKLYGPLRGSGGEDDGGGDGGDGGGGKGRVGGKGCGVG